MVLGLNVYYHEFENYRINSIIKEKILKFSNS